MRAFQKSDFKLAEHLIQEGMVGQCLFSGGTYQVEVMDPETKTVFWPFLQLGKEGQVTDCFCTCAQAEKKKSCSHLAAAYLKIFNGHVEPLHERFHDSLWNQLCQIASRRHSYETSCLKLKEGYEALSITGKRLFFVTPLTQKGRTKLEELITRRPVETEETSLKFSNLSPEELLLWKKGKPSHALSYELSFWSDLAKWWMLLQEAKEDYKIEFLYEKEALPKWILIHFKEVDVGFYLADVNWPQIIPALGTVQSPLAFYEFPHQHIRKVTYDPHMRSFAIDLSTEEEEISQREVSELEKEALNTREQRLIGDWVYISRRGFFPARQDPLLQAKLISADKVGKVLQKHPKWVQKYLRDVKIHLEPLKAQYHLSLDEAYQLRIECYVFEEGDLKRPLSAYFGPWVYLDSKGFYLLEGLLFEGVEKKIPKNAISDFVARHRNWLNAYEGFQTHLSGVESHLSYTLTKEHLLEFETRAEFVEEEEIMDLGEWIYVNGRGFYPKVTRRSGSYLRPGLKVASQDISRFIRTNQEELEHLPGFFTSHCPLEKSGLHIFLNEHDQIIVRPEYFFKSESVEARPLIFGDYVFVQKEGFSKIPQELQLPEGYSVEKRIDAASEPYFVSFELDLLDPMILSIDPRLKKPKTLLLKVERIQRDPKSKTGDWLIDLSYESELGSVGVHEMWHSFHEGRRYEFSSAGLVLLRQSRFNWLKNISKRSFLKKGKQIRLTTLQWLQLSIYEEIKVPQGLTKEAVESRRLLEELKLLQSDEMISLEGLKSELRPYQETGLRWLWFLYAHGLSGLLCDEMGLGKTHQAMALLAAVFNASSTSHHKYLVVCPTSVIYHWQELLKRFFPKLRAYLFYGQQREMVDFEEHYDLLLTSYGMLRSEKKQLSSLSFEIAIFDEIQVAKNTHSQTHKALGQIKAKMRLGLTGTPIENRLTELKALFDLILPNYMPQEAMFREFFVYPIERNQDPEKKRLLSKLIKPFLLRRKKSEVLLELPEKVEEISYCDLSDEQRELYKEIYRAQREGLYTALKDGQTAPSSLHVFALLNKLKQICDHPCLINKQLQDYQKHESGKWNLFVELLQEARDSGQKLVVFSQYLDMLDIIENYLTEKGIGFAGIRGSTRARKEQLEKFREDPSCEVFVASLQAAGVGVDLVSASVVVHYDRWWNPAKENQATDRVHRIGQSRGVQVFKFVTKGTIEEHIHRLIEKKLTLMEGVVGFDDQDQIKALDRKELLELLKLLDQDIQNVT